MPDSREFDVRYLEDLVLPYDKVTKELSDARARFVEGSDVFPTLGGKISLRPGLKDAGLTSFTVTKRPDRLVVYETVENPPKIYLIASLYNSGTGFWEPYYLRLDGAAPAWTLIGTLRDIDKSTRAHEFQIAHGWCLIKAFPGPTGDKYGTVSFDGSGATPQLYPWGIPGPTVAARITSPAGWSASANPVTVSFGWKYVYAYKSPTGHYSNRSPLESDPAQPKSDTGAFSNKKPAITIQGNADTAALPYIGIFRTTDGGGTFCFLEDIANTGAGSITYTDQHRVPTTTNDPKMDSQLDTQNIAPSMTSNTVPPPVPAGKVIGIDPVEPSTPLAYYARRVWYAVGNRIVFSGQEEIINGVPEESFPSPLGIRGNFYLVQGQPRLLKKSKSSLVIGSSDELLVIRGEDRSNLRIISIADYVSAASGHPRATASWNDAVFFLSQDLQVYAVVNDAVQLLSEPLGSDLRSAINANTEVVFETFARDGNFWLLVSVVDKVTPANTRTWVYDIKRNIWFVPWTVPIFAMAFGRLRESDQNKHLVVLTWNGTTGKLAVLDFDTKTDCGVAFAPSFITNLFSVPAGNHINALRARAHTPMLSYLLTERTKFAADTDPSVSYRLDEFTGAWSSTVLEDPPFVSQHTSWKSYWSPVQEVVTRVQMKVSRASVDEPFEIQNIGFVFQSEAGA